jgi:hypothetical protein
MQRHRRFHVRGAGAFARRQLQSAGLDLSFADFQEGRSSVNGSRPSRSGRTISTIVGARLLGVSEMPAARRRLTIFGCARFGAGRIHVDFARAETTPCSLLRRTPRFVNPDLSPRRRG